MLLQSHSCYFSSYQLCDRRRKHSSKASIDCLTYGMDAVAEIAHNKVLIAAAVSAAVGQLTKPLSAAILYGESFNIRAVFQAGGFPSTHSSAVVATATSLGLERPMNSVKNGYLIPENLTHFDFSWGFSDAIFGLAIVYASLTMYDAQGVRREVGTHAKTLNRMLRSRPHSLADSSSENSKSSKEPSKFRSKSNGSSVLLRSDSRMNQSTSVLISSSLSGGGGDDEESLSDGAQHSYVLKESVGHTEIEVIAGAFLGFCISLAVYYSV